MRPGSLALCCVHVSWGEAVVKAVFSGVFINESVPIWVFLLLYFHIDSVPSYWDVFTQLSHPQNPALRGQTEKGSWARLPPAHRHPEAQLHMGEQSRGAAHPPLRPQAGRGMRPEQQRPRLKATSSQPGPSATATPASQQPDANSLPNFINDFLLLLNFISKSGQLLVVSLPVALHLLLQRLLQARPREMCHPLVGPRPTL